MTTSDVKKAADVLRRLGVKEVQTHDRKAWKRMVNDLVKDVPIPDPGAESAGEYFGVVKIYGVVFKGPQ